jgi:short subunit dehydrogenase-like uncharacterized protein
MPTTDAKYDLVLYGATGFTGTLAVEYVVRQYGRASGFTWAIAGRSAAKLEALAAGAGAGLPDVIVADSGDKASLLAMVALAKVVATTAGPFARYGSSLVEACVETGTDYCDITGEVTWVREMVAAHDDAARRSGARIVSLCGHDSIPWDLSAYMLARRLRSEHGTALASVDFFDDINSAPSGGTLETAFGIMFGAESGKQQKKGTAAKALGYDPMLKTADGTASGFGLKVRNVGSYAAPDASLGAGAGSKLHRALFFMAGVNAYAVKRSNALNGYGASVSYREGASFRSFFAAAWYLLGLLAFGVGIYVPPLRWLLRRFVLPKPGEGPSRTAMEKGYLHVLGVAKGEDGSVARSTMSFNVDPGYKDTARMLVESALSFSLGEGCPSGGGVFTPAACQKEVLLERLLKTGTEFKFH